LLKKIVSEITKEYLRLSGKGGFFWKRAMVTTIIERMTENNYRFLQKSNGIWRQLFESEIRQNIQKRINRKNGVREVIIEDPDTKSKENKHWKEIEKEILFYWYSKKGIDISQLNADDFSGVAEQICRTWSACKSKLCHIQRDGLASDEKSGLINKWSKEVSDPNAKIPEEFRLKELCNVEGITISFSLSLIKKKVQSTLRRSLPISWQCLINLYTWKQKEAMWMMMTISTLTNIICRNALCQTILQGNYTTLMRRPEELRIRIFYIPNHVSLEDSYTGIVSSQITYQVHYGSTELRLTGETFMVMVWANIAII
jgi:hypothetical protein